MRCSRGRSSGCEGLATGCAVGVISLNFLLSLGRGYLGEDPAAINLLCM